MAKGEQFLWTAARIAFIRLGESLRAQVKCLESRALDWVGDSSMPGKDGRLHGLSSR